MLRFSSPNEFDFKFSGIHWQKLDFRTPCIGHFLSCRFIFGFVWLIGWRNFLL